MGEIAPGRLGIVGDGLIGRSVRLAWIRRWPRAQVLSLDRGDDLGALADADVVILATPVDVILSLLPAIATAAARASLVMDVGSTKQVIVRTARRAGMNSFVGGHPMAGGTTTGPAAARADLFDARPWFVVADNARASTVTSAVQIVEGLGASPVVMHDDGEGHDRVVAAISHLPQVVASALLARVGETLGAENLRWAAGGLRDTTRIAASSPDVWRGILATNHAAVSPLLRELATDLLSIADHLDDAAHVNALFARAHRWLPTRDDGR